MPKRRGAPYRLRSSNRASPGALAAAGGAAPGWIGDAWALRAPAQWGGSPSRPGAAGESSELGCGCSTQNRRTMAEEELDALRKQRLAELQAKHGVSAPARPVPGGHRPRPGWRARPQAEVQAPRLELAPRGPRTPSLAPEAGLGPSPGAWALGRGGRPRAAPGRAGAGPRRAGVSPGQSAQLLGYLRPLSFVAELFPKIRVFRPK